MYAATGFTEEEVAYQLAHINETKAPSIIAAVAVLSVLATIAIMLRVLVRWYMKSGFQADDYTIFCAWILCWGSFVCVYYETRCGLGKHVLASTPEMFTGLLKAFVFEGPNFSIGVMLTQLSILFLYKRVFTTNTAWFRYTLYTLGFLSFGVNISVFFAILFACTPVSLSWDKTVPGHCYEVRPVYLVQTALIFVLDLFIVVAPMPLVWNLHTNLGTKGAVAGMFLLGGFVCIINLIRIPFLARPAGNDPLWTDTPASIWTHAELCLGVVSACLPCFRPLYRGVRTAFSTNKSKSSMLTPPSRSKVSADPYKPLDGKDTSTNGSSVALQQWKAPYTPNVAIEGGRQQETESAVPLDAIGVTRDINVSRSSAR
ncbi:hypothetical protein MMC07_001960 [Pseudocyphellaria aurata]|nr:hypothetical protein [Pseudocyphellaria aurata]